MLITRLLDSLFVCCIVLRSVCGTYWSVYLCTRVGGVLRNVICLSHKLPWHVDIIYVLPVSSGQSVLVTRVRLGERPLTMRLVTRRFDEWVFHVVYFFLVGLRSAGCKRGQPECSPDLPLSYRTSRRDEYFINDS